MKQINRLAGLLFLLCAVPTLMVARPSLIQYVNTHIGTGAFKGRWSPGNEAKGQCMPAVLVPNGRRPRPLSATAYARSMRPMTTGAVLKGAPSSRARSWASCRASAVRTG